MNTGLRFGINTLALGCVLLSACMSASASEVELAEHDEALSAAQSIAFTPLPNPPLPLNLESGEIRTVITSASAFQRLFGQAAPAEVNFAAGENVAYYNAGTRTFGGVRASIERIELSGSTLVITTRVTSPGINCPRLNSLSFPVALVKFKRPREARSTSFVRDDRVNDCAKVVSCGGFLGTPCPGVGECVDDPKDDCDPNNGGADCSGVCQCTQPVTCPPGTSFNKSPAVCDCAPIKLGPLDNRCAVVLCPANTQCRIVEGEVACVPFGIQL